jgi:putative transposase
VYSFYAQGTHAPFRHRSEAFNSAALPHDASEAKIPHVVFAPRGASAWPEGAEQDLIDAVVAIKRHNPSWGCPRIAQQIALAFGVDIDEDLVRRVLRVHNRPESNSAGPSWLTFIGHL